MNILSVYNILKSASLFGAKFYISKICVQSLKRSDILVYTVGGSPAVKNALADPASPMEGIGAQSPINIGKTAVKTAAAILENGVYESEINVETFFINQDNVDMYGTDGWQ